MWRKWWKEGRCNDDSSEDDEMYAEINKKAKQFKNKLLTDNALDAYICVSN